MLPRPSSLHCPATTAGPLLHPVADPWAAFQKPKEGWCCDVCKVHNAVDATQCIACETAKPGAAAAAGATPGAFGFTFGGAPAAAAAAAATPAEAKEPSPPLGETPSAAPAGGVTVCLGYVGWGGSLFVLGRASSQQSL